MSREIGSNLPDNAPELNLAHDAVGPLQTMNMLLCMLKHLKYEENMKTGEACDGDVGYGVKMDLGQCLSLGANSYEAGSHVKVITVKSCRRDADAPHTVQVHFDGDQSRVFVEATIYSAPATSDGAATGDFGKFVLVWKDASGISQGALWTVAETGGVIDLSQEAQKGWRFMDASGPVSSSAVLVVEAGKRYASVEFKYENQSKTHSVAEYGNYFKIGDDTTTQCFDKTKFIEEIWSYDVWKKVSGAWKPLTPPKTSLQFQSASGCYGNLGLNGVSVDRRCSITDGDFVKESISGNQGRTFTYVKKSGKLEKKTPRRVNLVDLNGQVFTLSSGNYTLTLNPTTLTSIDTPEWPGVNLQVKYFSELGKTGFYIVKAASQSTSQNSAWVDVDDVAITGSLDMHYLSNNRYAFYDGTSPTLTTYDVRTVSPGELGAVTLLDTDNNNKQYTFHGETYTLLDGQKSMVGDAENEYDIESLIVQGSSDDVIYTWSDGWSSQGHSQANTAELAESFQGLKDAQSSYVTVGSPLMLNYTVESNDLRSGSGTEGDRVDFQYMGPGQLWGIQGAVENESRWSPQFSLKDGVIIQNANDAEYAEYAVYAKRGSRLMTAQSDANVCLDIDNVSVPDAPLHLPWVSSNTPKVPADFTATPVYVAPPTILLDWTL